MLARSIENTIFKRNHLLIIYMIYIGIGIGIAIGIGNYCSTFQKLFHNLLFLFGTFINITFSGPVFLATKPFQMNQRHSTVC